eukprot:1158344-Pelagomonas_calceolata.AAC.17
MHSPTLAPPTAIRVPNRCVNLVATQLFTTFSICSRLLVSMGKATLSTIFTASASACKWERQGHKGGCEAGHAVHNLHGTSQRLCQGHCGKQHDAGVVVTVPSGTPPIAGIQYEKGEEEGGRPSSNKFFESVSAKNEKSVPCSDKLK